MASVNAATVKYITSNLIFILSGLKGFIYEDGSCDTADKLTWVQLAIMDDLEEENHGEGSMYIEQSYEIRAEREIKDKSDHRAKSSEIKWEIKEAITVAALNIRDLAASKLVTKVESESDVNQYSSAKGLMVTVNITVRFRDLRT